MDYLGGFILQKDVNWSLLTEGLAIPTSVCSRFADWDTSILTHGASRPVKYRCIIRSIIIDYRDEISGEMIGDEYGDSVVEAHHIYYFTRSQNNDSMNIIIISPRSSSARLLPSGRSNYHWIIHKNNPRFNRKKFQFEFENGEVLRLKLYEQIKVE